LSAEFGPLETFKLTTKSYEQGTHFPFADSSKNQASAKIQTEPAFLTIYRI